MPKNERTNSSNSSSQAGFQSGVAGLKLCDILELKSGQKFHGLLVILHNKQTAKIYFNEGELQHAITPDNEGERAIREVLSWPGGKLKVLPQMTYPHCTIEKSLTTLLIETGHRQSVSIPTEAKSAAPRVSQEPALSPRRTSAKRNRRGAISVPAGMLAGVVLLLGICIAAGIYLSLPSFSVSAPSTAASALSNSPAAPVPAVSAIPADANQQNLFANPEKILTLQGSNTIGSELAPNLAKRYLQSKGATQIKIQTTAPEEVMVSGYFPEEHQARSIEIRAHGSTTSFEGLKSHVCDIGMASRRIKDEERLQLAPEGDMASANAEYVLAMDGVAVVVHPSNNLGALSIEQIAGLFSGEISDWSEISQSGLSGPVHVFARDENSGTYDTFKSLVLKPNKMKLAPAAQRYEDSQKLSDLVSADPNGIGFIGLPYISPSKAVAVQEKETQPVFPTAFTIATEDYPLSRRLYLYLPPKSASSSAREFIAFATSDEGQATAEEVGFVKLSVFEQNRALAGGGDIPADYAKMAREARRLSVNFRFDSGGNNLDNKAIQDLSRIVAYLNQETNRNRSISLYGFADNLGQYEKNCEISLERARSVKKALAAFGVFPSTTKGLCDSIPIASNQSRNGRNKNRRVEVWVNCK